MAKLAIKGHTTRGKKKVIKILKMLGGNNKTKWNGDDESAMYFIHENGNIKSKDIDYSIMKIFTLEEFLEKFPYKIGDKVIAYVDGCLAQFTIQGIRWNHELNKVEYRICSSWRDTSLIQPYKEKTMEASKEFFNKYCVNCGSQRCTAEGEWLEGCEHYKEETMDKASKTIFDVNAQCCDIMNHLIKEETMEEKSLEQKINVSELMEKYDNVNNPKHYTVRVPIIRVKCECGKVLEIPVECIDVIRNMPTWKGNVIKYLWREGLKEDASLSGIEKEIEDLKKAEWYLKDKIRILEEKL